MPEHANVKQLPREPNNESYRLIVENAIVPIVHYTPDGCFLFINTFAATNLGKKPADLIGKSLYELFPKKAAEFRKRNRQLLETGNPRRYEDAIDLPSGTRWFSSVAKPLKDENGMIFAVQVISHDITNLKRREKALHALSSQPGKTNAEISDSYESLTAREQEVFRLTAEGYNRTEIAEQLGISPRTAEAHRASAMHKLGLHTRAELIRHALQTGIVPLKS
jgi:PAS domain S-box-containing protein